MLSLVINDSFFAAIIGVGFTSILALMAWIVKTLLTLTERVLSHDQRITNIERWKHPQVGRVGVAIVLAVLLVGSLFTGSLVLSARQNARTACRTDQRLYDGQIKYTLFLAKQFHATQAQIDKGLVDLRETLGPRPDCN